MGKQIRIVKWKGMNKRLDKRGIDLGEHLSVLIQHYLWVYVIGIIAYMNT